MRDFKNGIFQIHQNMELIYSMPKCTTTDAIDTSYPGISPRMPCFEGNWTIGIVEKVIPHMQGACTKLNSEKYWCPVEIVSKDNNFKPETDKWGFCHLICLENEKEKRVIQSHIFSR